MNRNLLVIFNFSQCNTMSRMYIHIQAVNSSVLLFVLFHIFFQLNIIFHQYWANFRIWCHVNISSNLLVNRSIRMILSYKSRNVYSNSIFFNKIKWLDSESMQKNEVEVKNPIINHLTFIQSCVQMSRPIVFHRCSILI